MITTNYTFRNNLIFSFQKQRQIKMLAQNVFHIAIKRQRLIILLLHFNSMWIFKVTTDCQMCVNAPYNVFQ
jgi:hypothetical protein